jgi:hypothetical protein
MSEEENLATNEDVATDETVNETAPEATTAPQLQINDLKILAQVVEVGSKRGAIKPNEMAVVGATYDRLIQFLTANGAITPPATEEAPVEGDTPSTDEVTEEPSTTEE